MSVMHANDQQMQSRAKLRSNEQKIGSRLLQRHNVMRSTFFAPAARRLIGVSAAAALMVSAAPMLTGVSSAAVTSLAPVVGIAPTPSGHGYWETASDGGIFAFGDAQFYGSMGGQRLNAAVVGIAPTPSGHGYWETASDGGVFAFGDAEFYGSMGGQRLNAAVVGIAPTPSGHGYWETASDGGVFAFGDAQFCYGSMGGQRLNAAVVGIAPTPSGHGYWETASDGGVFAFGDAQFYGSMGGQRLNNPVSGIIGTASRRGYSFPLPMEARSPTGTPPSEGPLPEARSWCRELHRRIPDCGGYWMAAADGAVFAFGDASHLGRANYTPPLPTPSTLGQKAANLASGWVGGDYHGVNNDYWNAPSHPELWCADFLTYTWQQAGINIPHISYVPNLESWARSSQRWFANDIAHPHVGDAVIYGSSHTDIVVQVFSNGSVVSVDGDWAGQRGSDTLFASTSHVKINTWNPSNGLGAGGMVITGYVRAG